MEKCPNLSYQNTTYTSLLLIERPFFSKKCVKNSMYSAGPSELAKPNMHFTTGEKTNVYLTTYKKFYSRDYY